MQVNQDKLLNHTFSNFSSTAWKKTSHMFLKVLVGQIKMSVHVLLDFRLQYCRFLIIKCEELISM